jgi:hypothetical protein
LEVSFCMALSSEVTLGARSVAGDVSYAKFLKKGRPRQATPRRIGAMPRCEIG